MYLFQQFRCKRYVIRRNRPELQGAENLRPKRFQGQLVGSASLETLSRIGIDMVCTFADIPLCQMGEHGSFWQDHPEQCVCLFNTAFLPAAHGITVINTHASGPVYTGLQPVGIVKFTAPVGKTDSEYGLELISAQCAFQPVNGRSHSALGAAFQQACDKKPCLRYVKSKNALAGSSGGKDCVHRAKAVRPQGFEILESPSNEDIPVPDPFFRMFSWPEMGLALEIDIAYQEDTVVSIIVEGFHADPQFGMAGRDGVRGLSPGNQRSNDGIHLQSVMSGKVHAFP